MIVYREIRMFFFLYYDLASLFLRQIASFVHSHRRRSLFELRLNNNPWQIAEMSEYRAEVFAMCVYDGNVSQNCHTPAFCNEYRFFQPGVECTFLVYIYLLHRVYECSEEKLIRRDDKIRQR